MSPSQLLLVRTALTIAVTPAVSSAVGFLSDPLVTHTNGMRLASTTALRSHNAYWQPDPGHLGYCDGYLYSPCRNDWRSLGTRHRGQFAPPATPLGMTANQGHHLPDGLEVASGESLGAISAASVGTLPTLPATEQGPGALPDLRPADSPTQSDIWIDTLQTLGRKMMSTPEE